MEKLWNAGYDIEPGAIDALVSTEAVVSPELFTPAVAEFAKFLSIRRDRAVLAQMVAHGLTNRQIAVIGGTTEQVIKNKIRGIVHHLRIAENDTMGKNSRVLLARWWIVRGQFLPVHTQGKVQLFMQRENEAILTSDQPEAI